MSRDKHLTPLEFANTLVRRSGMMITRAYNRVRFGGQRLSANEKREIERALVRIRDRGSGEKRPLMKKVGFVSLGCPKNLVDSEVMMGQLKHNGYEITADAAQTQIQSS